MLKTLPILSAMTLRFLKVGNSYLIGHENILGRSLRKGLENEGHRVGVVEDDEALDHGDVVGHLSALVHVNHVAKQLATVSPVANIQ